MTVLNVFVGLYFAGLIGFNLTMFREIFVGREVPNWIFRYALPLWATSVMAMGVWVIFFS